MHFGSLLAVCLYFRRDLVQLAQGAAEIAPGRVASGRARLALGIALGTIPAAVAGLAFADWIEANLRSPVVIVTTLSFYAVLMVLADRLGQRGKGRVVGRVGLTPFAIYRLLLAAVILYVLDW